MLFYGIQIDDSALAAHLRRRLPIWSAVSFCQTPPKPANRQAPAESKTQKLERRRAGASGKDCTEHTHRGWIASSRLFLNHTHALSRDGPRVLGIERVQMWEAVRTHQQNLIRCGDGPPPARFGAGGEAAVDATTGRGAEAGAGVACFWSVPIPSRTAQEPEDI